MKLNGITKDMKCLRVLIGILFASISYNAFADGMNCIAPCASEKLYFGVFGGIGETSKIKISQYGTAFYTPDLGGPLAVDAFGNTNHRSVSLFGGHIGYQFTEIFPAPCSCWAIAPAVEWEGYYIGKTTFTSDDINNNTERLNEHDFHVTYPMNTGVFLVNAVLNLNLPCHSRFHPYVGAGIGGAVVSISNANATQIAPPEPGVNHFNSNPSDTDAAFAAQGKLGLSFDLCKKINIFAEYRLLYLSGTDYAFGSTVSPGHAATSNWLVEFDHQHYNIGAIGIQYSI
jgi:opacity protein-like surface antigen